MHKPAIVLSLTLCSAVGCGPSGPADPSTTRRPPTPVRVERVALQPFAPTWVTPGIVEPEARVSLAFRVGGEIARFAIDEGDRVEAGDAIATLDLVDLERAVRTARSAVARAVARAEEAEIVFARQQRLIELASTSQQRFEAARSSRRMVVAELDRARLELETAEERLRRGTLLAPRAGYIESRLADAHEHAAPGVAVVVLTALDEVTVRSAISDVAAAHLREGAAAAVRSPAWPERVFEGRVSHVALAADPVTRTVPFEVRLANPELALKPEMAVDVELRVASSRPLPAVPLVSVLRGLDAVPFSFVAVGEGEVRRVERRVLELGPIHGAHVLARSGLVEGDLVLARGQHFVRAGDRVRLVDGLVDGIPDGAEGGP